MRKILFTIIFLATATFSFAQLQYEMVSYSNPNGNNANTPLFNINIFNQPTFTISYQSFANGFQSIFDLIIGISIATAVIVFMIAAFQKIISGGDVKGIKAGDDGMKNAIIGLMIILSTWLIINTINPDLLRLPIFSGLDKLSNSTQQSGGATQDNVTGGSN